MSTAKRKYEDDDEDQVESSKKKFATMEEEDASSKSARVRKKSAKVLEMEEFEKIEKLQVTKKPTPETPKGAKSTTMPVISNLLTAKKSTSGTPTPSKPLTVPAVPSIGSVMTAAVAPVKISAVPGKSGVVSHVKELPVTPTKAVTSPVQLLGSSPGLTVPGGLPTKGGSVIKLLLNSPTQPTISTKNVAKQAESPPVSKKSARQKAKQLEMALAAVDPVTAVKGKELEVPKLKLLLGPNPQVVSPAKETPLTVNTSVSSRIKAATSPSSGEGGLKVKLILSPGKEKKEGIQSFEISPTQGPADPTMSGTGLPSVKTPRPKKSRKKKESGDQSTASHESGIVGTSPQSGVITNPIKVPVPPSSVAAILQGGVMPGFSHLAQDGGNPLLTGGQGETTPASEKPPKKPAKSRKKNTSPKTPSLKTNMPMELPAVSDGSGDGLLDFNDDETGLVIAEDKTPKPSKVKRPSSGGKSAKKKIKLESPGLASQSDLATDINQTPALLPVAKMKLKGEKKLTKKAKKAAEKSLKKEEAEKAKKKRAPTAYMLWCNNNRRRVVAESPGIDFAQISRRLGEIWQALPEKEKMAWKRKAKKAAGKGSTLISTGKRGTAGKLIQTPLTSGTAALSTTRLVTHPTAVVKPVKAIPEDVNLSPIKGFGIEPVDVAAHLKLLGESLSIIGMRLQEHKGMIAVQGSLSVLLDSMLCACAPLMCLTAQVPELDGCPQQTHAKILDNIAYFMPGL